MNIMKQLTYKAEELGLSISYTDETLRFERTINDNDRIIDPYSLSLDELEQLLNIRCFNPRNHYNNLSSNVYNDWYEVIYRIDEIRSQNDFYTHSNIVGYEIYNEHYIKLYNTCYVSNS